MNNVVVTRRGWFQRLGDSIKGIVAGLVLVVISFPVLWVNEGRAVMTHKALVEGASSVVSVEASAVDGGREGALIHVTGPVSVEGAISDPLFGVQVGDSTRLQRVVEMYQWRETSRTETRTTLGGGEERVTTYSYEMVWSDSPISSGGFNDTTKQNPGSFPFNSETFNATEGRLGAFVLDGSHFERMTNFQEYPLPEGAMERVQASVRDGLTISGGGFYRGANPQQPQIGDLRVRFQRAPTAAVTLVGKQHGQTLRPYTTSNGRQLFFVEMGNRSAQEVFDDAIAGNKVLTWILRGVGFFLMFLGLSLLFGPLGVIADVIPLFGSIVRTGTSLVAFLIAAPLSLLTISFAWLFYRPLLSILLFAAVGGLVYGLKKVWKPAKEGAAPVATEPAA